ncbi:hypothetical protein Sango_0499300 [Sesamum angolense]|uniref:Uncharacterized protein n=1 Tax=Sesamum angolense TaxID=2727404 RepID=A0AAE1XD17_9LAMI|nr:hypothetical protein Sango_0499300 [Sesamum angolense]
MCLRGFDTSTPPACSTNSAGENELPWQTHMMLTSVLVYLYRNPVTVLPFGPFPVVETRCIRGAEAMSCFWCCGGLGGLSTRPVGSFDGGEIGFSLVELVLLV